MFGTTPTCNNKVRIWVFTLLDSDRLSGQSQSDQGDMEDDPPLDYHLLKELSAPQLRSGYETINTAPGTQIDHTQNSVSPTNKIRPKKKQQDSANLHSVQDSPDPQRLSPLSGDHGK